MALLCFSLSASAAAQAAPAPSTGPAFVAGSQLADGANTSHLALFIDP